MITWTIVTTIVVACASLACNLAYVLTDQRRASKKPLRAVNALVIFYFIGLYAFALMDPMNYWVRSGLLSRIGLIVLFSVLAGEVIADWRRGD